MQFTSNWNQLLASAVKGKAPVVALPMEGAAPFCIDRKRLAAWIKGVTVTAVTPLGISGTSRWLQITGCAGNVRTTCKLPAIDRRTALQTIRIWAEKERERNLKIIHQGAIGATAIAAAKKLAAKTERAQAKAAKLAEIETGGTEEQRNAQLRVFGILNQARAQGRGPKPGKVPSLKLLENIDSERAETTVKFVAYHNTPRHVRSAAAVIGWRLKALRTAWFEVTKFNPSRRKSTKNVFLKAAKAARVMQIVRDHYTLIARYNAIAPAKLPNPRWADHEDMHWTDINPLHRPKMETRSRCEVWGRYGEYDRTGLAVQLREAREIIRILTPPPDEAESLSTEVLEMPAPVEYAKAA